MFFFIFSSAHFMCFLSLPYGSWFIVSLLFYLIFTIYFLAFYFFSFFLFFSLYSVAFYFPPLTSCFFSLSLPFVSSFVCYVFLFVLHSLLPRILFHFCFLLRSLFRFSFLFLRLRHPFFPLFLGLFVPIFVHRFLLFLLPLFLLLLVFLLRQRFLIC